jgi:hypothetical protein
LATKLRASSIPNYADTHNYEEMGDPVCRVADFCFDPSLQKLIADKLAAKNSFVKIFLN